MERAYAFSDRATLERVLNLVRKPIDLTVGSSRGPAEDVFWAEVTERISDVEAKCKQVIRKTDGSTVDYNGGFIWDDDEPQEERNKLPNLKAFEGYTFPEEGGVVQAMYLALDNEAEWYGFPPAAGGGGLEYIQITAVDYTKNNDYDPASFVYKGVRVPSLTQAPLSLPVDPEDEEDILINGGYPWNLKVGDNLTIIGGTDYLICNNDLEPEPIVKIVSGVPYIWDTENGSQLTIVRPTYDIMSDPNDLQLDTFDNNFLLSQWSKRSNVVRIYIPVI